MKSQTREALGGTMQSFQVIDTHTAGHPTRAIMGGMPPLKGDTVLARRDEFRKRHDHLRGRLLHEPRGHAAMVGAIMTESTKADFGAFFVSSYVYLDMCGHATIGLARTLVATGQVSLDNGPNSFTLETPAGIVEVGVSRAQDGAITASILNVPAYVERDSLGLDVPELGTIEATIVYCGGRFAMVDASAHGWTIEPDHAGDLCRKGMAVKTAANAALDAPVGSVLFINEHAPDHARHLVVLEGHKFDRSPCGTGSSARLAALHARGMLQTGETYLAESILGTRYRCRIEETLEHEGHAAIRPRIDGEAWLSAFSTLVVEDSDPLADGFLCR
jgi:proline racemase